jgi:excisionase family DNA binding protein
MTPKALLTIPQASERLSIGRTQTYTELMSGRLQSVKIGRRRLIPEVAIEAYVQRLLDEAAVLASGHPTTPCRPQEV